MEMHDALRSFQYSTDHNLSMSKKGGKSNSAPEGNREGNRLIIQSTNMEIQEGQGETREDIIVASYWTF